MASPSPNKWIVCRQPRSDASMRLFCLAWAGGNSTAFGKWKNFVPNTVEVCAIELPGRLSRSKEEHLKTMSEVVDGAAQALAALGMLDKPFALFGHSMGALVAFELALKLRADGGKRTPSHLIVSGCRPPHLRGASVATVPVVSQLPRDQLIEHLVLLGGIAGELRDHEELLDFFLPTIRADYRIFEGYKFNSSSPQLQCPITCLVGSEDSGALRTDLEQWAHKTTGEFQLSTFSGGHFFLRDGDGEGEAAVAGFVGELIAPRQGVPRSR